MSRSGLFRRQGYAGWLRSLPCRASVHIGMHCMTSCDKQAGPIEPIEPLKASTHGQLLMVDDDRFRLLHNETPQLRSVRFRTLGCYPLTAAIESTASTLEAIISEMAKSRLSERQGRLIDHDDTAAMEKKKREGYF